jgi:hypothetical protein
LGGANAQAEVTKQQQGKQDKQGKQGKQGKQSKQSSNRRVRTTADDSPAQLVLDLGNASPLPVLSVSSPL